LDLPGINFSLFHPTLDSGDDGDDDSNEGNDDEGGDDDGYEKDGKSSSHGYDDDDGNGGEASGGLWGQVTNWTGWTGWNGWPGNGNNGRAGGGNGSEGEDEGYVVTNEDIADGNNGGNEDPFESFDIAQCATYANLWLWDLSLSCDSAASLDSCECTFTEELMAEAMITCDDINNCPAECPVCVTCFKLAGCEPAPTFFQSEGVSASMILAICSAGGLFLFAILYYVIRRRQMSHEHSLGVHLLDKGQQNSTLPKGTPPDKSTGPYEYETTMAPFSSIPDFGSDLSSLESNTFESDHTSSTPETPVRQVMEIETASAPPSPQSDAGDLPFVYPNVDALNQSAPSTETKPTATISTAATLVPASAAVVLAATSAAVALAATSTSAAAPASPQINASVRKAPLSPNIAGKRAIAALPVISIEPITTALVSTSPQIKSRVMTPPIADAANLDVPTAVRLGQSVRHAKAVGAIASVESANPLEATLGLKVTPNSEESAQVSTIEKAETSSLANTTSISDVAAGQETKQQGWTAWLTGPTIVAASSLKPSTATTLNTSEDAVLHTTKVAAIGSSSAHGDESTNGGSTQSHRENGYDEDSESPWIGDVDVSFERPVEEHAKHDRTEDPEQIDAAEGESAHSEASTQKSDVIDLSPAEPPSVWLVPLDDLEGETDQPEPSGDVHEEIAEEPMVWLVPSSSLAVLVPEQNEDDSTSESSWSPDEQSGPWLAPI
jgi:hypothetical protein